MLSLAKPVLNRMMPQVFEKFKHEIESDYRAHQEDGNKEPEYTSEQIQDAAYASLRENSDNERD